MIPNAEKIDLLVNQSDSFGHELRVGSLLGKIPNCDLRHGGTYIDPSQKIPRQFDYRAFLQDGNREIRMAIECKNIAPESPIIICGIHRPKAETKHSLIQTQPNNAGAHEGPIDWDTVTFSDSESFYKTGVFTGKSVVRAKYNNNTKAFDSIGDGDIYTTWNQAVSSCYDLCQEATSYIVELSPFFLFTAVIPIVVIPNDTLWRVTYSDNGRIIESALKVDYCEYLVDNRVKLRPNIAGGARASLNISHLHFYTLSGFEKLTAELMNGGDPHRPTGKEDTSFWGRLFPQIPRNNLLKSKTRYR